MTSWTRTTSSPMRSAPPSRFASGINSERLSAAPSSKNRTFWFADYEGLREREGVPRVRPSQLPLKRPGCSARRSSTPSRPDVPSSAGTPGSVGDSADRWDPVGARIVALIPDPNVPGTTIFASTPVTATRRTSSTCEWITGFRTT